MALITALAVAFACASRTMAQEEVARAYAGEWRLADRDAEARIDRAVARVTQQMNFFVRTIASERIDEAVNPDRRVLIEPAGARHIMIAVGRDRPVRLPLNGRYVRAVSPEGRAFRMRAMVAHGQLTIQETTDEGSRVLYFQNRGDALVMSTRIQSHQLPADIVYQLRYQRMDAPRIASR
jgi:hypothetical protein